MTTKINHKNTNKKNKLNKLNKMNKKNNKTHKKNRNNKNHKKNKKNKKTISEIRAIKEKKYKKAKCSPKTEGVLPFSCYTSESLHKLKDIWNARHPDVQVEHNDPKSIWDTLMSYMSSSCNTESCWLKHQCIKNDIDPSLWNNSFAPKSPSQWEKKPNEWLSSVDIENVMKQYEQVYKCFDFIGPSPIDFDKSLLWGECVWEELCKFQLREQLIKGKKKIGIIFNLDKHTDEGSHWVSMFINIENKEIYYFDSYGDRVPKLIYNFVKKIKKQAEEINQKFKFKWVSKRHQYSSSECGMYSIFFIIELLKDSKNFHDFQNNKYSDKYMKKLRKIYFNSHRTI
jgi:hypothetical protein